MADAGVVRDGERLPWLEPYRAPAKEKRGGPRVALVAAAMISVAAALSIPGLRTADIPADQLAPPPQVSRALPAPDAMKLDVPELPLTTRVAGAPAPRAAMAQRRLTTHRAARRPARRIVTAGPERESFELIVSEQIANLPPTAPVIQPAPPPVIPLRPAVNPKAQLVRGKTAQLGVYLTARQAEAAWRSAIKDYTFLVTMPKDIQTVRLGTSTRPFYRLQLGTPSRRHAQQLCRNLRQTGRACTVA